MKDNVKLFIIVFVFGFILFNVGQCVVAKSSNDGSTEQLMSAEDYLSLVNKTHKVIDQVKGGELTTPPYAYMQAVTVPIKTRIGVIGDLNGDIKSLEVNLERLRSVGCLNGDIVTKDSYLVFLGDYVNYGYHGLEVLQKVMKLKMNNPKKVFMLRGHNEFESQAFEKKDTLDFTLKNELELKFPHKWKEISESLKKLWDDLPQALFVGAKIEVKEEDSESEEKASAQEQKSDEDKKDKKSNNDSSEESKKNKNDDEAEKNEESEKPKTNKKYDKYVMFSHASLEPNLLESINKLLKNATNAAPGTIKSLEFSDQDFQENKLRPELNAVYVMDFPTLEHNGFIWSDVMPKKSPITKGSVPGVVKFDVVPYLGNLTGRTNDNWIWEIEALVRGHGNESGGVLKMGETGFEKLTSDEKIDVAKNDIFTFGSSPEGSRIQEDDACGVIKLKTKGYTLTPYISKVGKINGCSRASVLPGMAPAVAQQVLIRQAGDKPKSLSQIKESSDKQKIIEGIKAKKNEIPCWQETVDELTRSESKAKAPQASELKEEKQKPDSGKKEEQKKADKPKKNNEEKTTRPSGT